MQNIGNQREILEGESEGGRIGKIVTPQSILGNGQLGRDTTVGKPPQIMLNLPR